MFFESLCVQRPTLKVCLLCFGRQVQNRCEIDFHDGCVAFVWVWEGVAGSWGGGGGEGWTHVYMRTIMRCMCVECSVTLLRSGHVHLCRIRVQFKFVSQVASCGFVLPSSWLPRASVTTLRSRWRPRHFSGAAKEVCGGSSRSCVSA